MDQSRQGELALPVRYYRMWPALKPQGFTEEVLRLPVSATCFIELHCWNSGWPGGPALPVDRWAMHYGVPQGVEDGCDVLVRQITQTRIVPAMAAARAAGMTIVHVQPRYIASKYPQSQYLLEPDVKEEVIPPAVPGWRQQLAEWVGGPGLHEWEGRSQMAIAPPLIPRDGDYVIITGAQFDRVLRERGIVNLIYTGFHTNWCIPHEPASMREMAHRYCYRTILLRDCTLAVELADTLPRCELTNAAIRDIEMQVGPTAISDDFLSACAKAGAG